MFDKLRAFFKSTAGTQDTPALRLQHMPMHIFLRILSYLDGEIVTLLASAILFPQHYNLTFKQYSFTHGHILLKALDKAMRLNQYRQVQCLMRNGINANVFPEKTPLSDHPFALPINLGSLLYYVIDRSRQNTMVGSLLNRDPCPHHAALVGFLLDRDTSDDIKKQQYVQRTFLNLINSNNMISFRVSNAKCRTKGVKLLSRVECLLRHGANANVIDRSSMTSSYGGMTVFHQAICSNNFSLVELFLRYGAEVHLELALTINNEITQHFSPLHLAIKAGCVVDIVRLLLDHGADVNQVDHWGQTLLMCIEDEKYRVKDYLKTQITSRTAFNVLIMECLERYSSKPQLDQSAKDKLENFEKTEIYLKEFQNKQVPDLPACPQNTPS